MSEQIFPAQQFQSNANHEYLLETSGESLILTQNDGLVIMLTCPHLPTYPPLFNPDLKIFVWVHVIAAQL